MEERWRKAIYDGEEGRKRTIGKECMMCCTTDMEIMSFDVFDAV